MGITRFLIGITRCLIVYASRIPPGLLFLVCWLRGLPFSSIWAPFWCPNRVPVGVPGVPLSYIGVRGGPWAPLVGASWALGGSLGSPWGVQCLRMYAFMRVKWMFSKRHQKSIKNMKSRRNTNFNKKASKKGAAM